jgi:uncharacterized iron-regulated membrane protein
MNRTEPRQLWVMIHRYLGLATLAFLALAAITGCILCFSKPLDALLNADLFRRRAHAAPGDPVAAITRLEQSRPDLRVTAFPTRPPTGGNLQVSVEPRTPDRPLGYDEVFVDPASGAVAGVREMGPGWDRRHLIEGVFQLHYTLLAGDWGRWLMGLCALSWFIGNFVGLYLTLPTRGPFLKAWWRVWTFRLKNPLPRLFLDLHRASGLWLLIGATVLAFTSTAMNFFDEAFTPAVQALSPAKASPFEEPAPPAAARPEIGFAAALRAGETSARLQHPGWRPAKVSYVAERNVYGVMLTRSGRESYRGLGPVSYWYDGRDGRFIYEDNPYTDSPGRKVSRSLYPLHTGQVAGAIGVAFIFIVGLATVEMSVTGAYVWWKKRGPRIAAKKARARAGVAA